MSSRQEEKERRRKEREALEQAAQAAAARKKRLGMAAIALAAIVAIAVVGLAVGGVLGGDDEGSGGSTDGPTADAPAFDAVNLAEAASAAKCEVTRDRNEGSDHVTEKVEYQKNPPTSGDHSAEPARDGEYSEGPDAANLLHTLEHGRIAIQYKPGTPPQRVAQLRSVFNESVKGTEAYKSLLFENPTGMTYAVAATAWTRSLTCPQWNDRVFDAIRKFREDFVDKGPEFVP